MLLLLGVFFYIGSAALLEDLKFEGDTNTAKGWNDDQVDYYYKSAAYNCWIAAAAYLITFVIAIWQNKLATRSGSM